MEANSSAEQKPPGRDGAKATVVVDFGGMEKKLLKKIFSLLRYGDVYFCTLVCNNWRDAALEYFKALPRLHALKMTHDPWPTEELSSYSMCPSCIHIALSMGVNATEFNLCLAPYKSLITDDERFNTIFGIFREAGLINRIRLILVDESTKPLCPALARYFPSAEVRTVNQ